MSTDNSPIETNKDGFLINSEQWTNNVAIELARIDHIELTPEHWEILHFIRNYYYRFDHLPNARLFVKAVKTELGEQIGNSLYLYRLFPNGPAKYACKYAGLPKPPGCI
jgi:tRNA 2-thiouridine synthesizing protein E